MQNLSGVEGAEESCLETLMPADMGLYCLIAICACGSIVIFIV